MLPSAAVLRRWFLLTILTVAYGMGAFGMLGVSPLAPSLVDGFRLSRLDVAFIVPSVYLAACSSRSRPAIWPTAGACARPSWVG